MSAGTWLFVLLPEAKAKKKYLSNRFPLINHPRKKVTIAHISTSFSFSTSFQSGDEDQVMSDNEYSRDGDSPDALARVPASDVDPETLDKLRRQASKIAGL